MNKETVPQIPGYYLGSLANSGNSNGVLGEVVSYDQDVLCPTSIRFQRQVVHAYEFKWLTCLDVYKASGFLSLGFAMHASFTGSILGQ